MDKATEERAKAYADAQAGGCYTDKTSVQGVVWNAAYKQYIDIATEQQKIDIDKACSDHTIEQLGNLFIDTTISCKQRAYMAKEIIKRAMEE